MKKAEETLYLKDYTFYKNGSACVICKKDSCEIVISFELVPAFAGFAVITEKDKNKPQNLFEIKLDTKKVIFNCDVPEIVEKKGELISKLIMIANSENIPVNIKNVSTYTREVYYLTNFTITGGPSSFGVYDNITGRKIDSLVTPKNAGKSIDNEDNFIIELDDKKEVYNCKLAEVVSERIELIYSMKHQAERV